MRLNRKLTVIYGLPQGLASQGEPPTQLDARERARAWLLAKGITQIKPVLGEPPKETPDEIPKA